MNVSIRRLQPDEWELFRRLRLRALQSDPGVFGGNYADESARPDSVWRERLQDEKRAMFAVFEGDTPIGLTGVVPDKNDPSAVMLVASWLDPACRGRGLSALFYDARIDWARRQDWISRIVVSVRLGNEASRRANRKYGFTETHRAARLWPDGVEETEVFYELVL